MARYIANSALMSSRPKSANADSIGIADRNQETQHGHRSAEEAKRQQAEKRTSAAMCAIQRTVGEWIQIQIAPGPFSLAASRDMACGETQPRGPKNDSRSSDQIRCV